MKLEEKWKKMAATAALLDGRNADGSVSDFVFLLLSSLVIIVYILNITLMN